MHGYHATTNMGHTADDIDYSMKSKCKRKILGAQSPIAHKLTFFKGLCSENEDPRTTQRTVKYA